MGAVDGVADLLFRIKYVEGGVPTNFLSLSFNDFVWFLPRGGAAAWIVKFLKTLSSACI